MTEKPNDERIAQHRLFLAATTFGLVLFLSVALVSYNGLVGPDEGGSFTNLCGSVGQMLARGLIRTMGVGSFALSFFLIFVGYSFLIGRAIRNPALKVVGALLLMATLATLVHCISPAAGYSNSVYPLGGVGGEWCGALLRGLFGGIGAFLILGLMGFASLTLATDTLFIDVMRRLPEITRQILTGVKGPAAAAGGFLRGAAKRRSEPNLAPVSGPVDTCLTDDLFEEANNDVDEDDEDSEDEDESWATLDTEAEEDEDEEVEVVDESIEEDDEAASEDSFPQPVISSGRVVPSSDGVDIIHIQRAKHLVGLESYELPPPTLLDEPPETQNKEREAKIREKAHRLEEALKTFKVNARVTKITRGPTITVYEVSPEPGTKVSRITSLSDDISMALEARSIRIVAPIPGKATVGIEVPNDIREVVSLKELACSEVLAAGKFEIPILLGRDATGEPLITDLTKMPHMLIAGQTGSGKSVCINSIIVSLLLTKYPEEVRLILVDPKVVELQQFANLPHLLTPVVTDMTKASKVLNWVVDAMERRYKMLSQAHVTHIRDYNNLGEEALTERLADNLTPGEIEEVEKYLPYIVVIVDEFADLMMASAKDVENAICRLAQKSRAVGIHVILATQRPSADVLTGLIKANMPSRLAFRVQSKMESRIILDQAGADRLQGHGDLLYLPPSGAAAMRCQATLVETKEIKRIVDYIVKVAKPEYSQELTQVDSGGGAADSVPYADRDPLYHDAIRAVLAAQRGSVSMLQRKLSIGYTRAARLVDFMTEDGVVGDFKGAKAREVLMTLEQWEAGQIATSNAAENN